MPQILLVDDRDDSANILQLALQGLGFHVSRALSGENGIKLLKLGKRPDLIISNLLMSGMDGLTFIDHVRAHQDWSNIPVVIVSTAASEDGKRAAFQHGADAFLNKPFHFSDLNKVLNNLGIVPARA
jgi:CheY-like chemotaxis protein